MNHGCDLTPRPMQQNVLELVCDPTDVKILLGSQFDGQQLAGILALGAELEQVESASPAPEALLVVERPAG